MFGGADYRVTIFATDYESYTNENTLSIDCYKDGNTSLFWHTGGRYEGGSYPYNLILDYKYDDEAPGHLEQFSNFKAADLVIAAKTHKRLAFKGELGLSQAVFFLAELKAKVGPKSVIGKQCARELGFSP